MNFNNISYWNVQLHNYTGKNWGVSRVFKWLRSKSPYIGESAILAHILQHSAIRYSRFSIARCIRTYFHEKLESNTRNWLLNLSNASKKVIS